LGRRVQVDLIAVPRNQSGNCDVLIDCGPIDPDTSADQAMVSQVFFACVLETGELFERDYDFPPV
jgi:hypothetical protein